MTEPPDDPVEALFHQAVELPTLERTAFLNAACHGDPVLRAEVEGLLACDESTPPRGSLLDNPLVRRSGTGTENGFGIGPGPGPAFGPPAAAGEVGTLGPYRVVRPLGQGGMGTVYAALDTRLERRLALKVMLPQFAADPAAKERFLREARAAAQVTHDNVVTVYEADERDGVAYIAMQFLEGCSLDEYLRDKGALPLPQVLRIARQAADGLAAAHLIGLVHRDVKPGNLWLEAPHGRVKVLDFGLAKPLDARVGVTLTGAVVGTPAYMSPEQARGQKLDHRTDLFSLGAVLYRLCGGRLPFEGPSTMAVLMALGTEEPPPLRELNPAVPEPLAELIHQMLSKKPDARPRSAADVAARVRAMADGATPPARPAADVQHPFTDPDPAEEPTEFEPLSPEQGAAAPAPVRKGARPARRRLAAGLVTLLAVAVAGVIVIMRTRDGMKTNSAVLPGTNGTMPDKGVSDNADAWEKAVVRMDAPDQVTAVGVRLKKLNPKFDETSLSHRIENGVVVDVEVGDASGLKDLAPLCALTGLKDLHLHGRFVGAADIGPLRGLKLESFQSNGCPHKDLSPLAGMPLTRANFWGCKTTDLSPLRGMKLVETNVGHSSIKDISVLKGMPLEMVCLNISNVEDLSPLAGAPLRRLFAANIKAKDLKPVADAPIEWLCINGTPIEDLTPLLTMPIQNLEIDNPQRHATLLRQIPTLKTINHRPVAEVLGDAIERTDPNRHAAEWALRLGGSVWIDDRQGDIKDIADLPQDRFTLTNVNLPYQRAVTDASLENLRGLKGLRLLNLGGTSVTDEGLIRLKEHTGLTHLVLERLMLTKRGLAHLKDLKELQVLHLHSVPVTDDGLYELMDLKGLTALNLCHARLTEAGLARLKQFKALNSLGLGGTAATDDTLEHLKDLELTSLELTETKLTDTGLARLQHFKGLRTLQVDKTAVTAQGLADFHAAVPGCRIYHDGGTIEPI